MQGLEPWPTVPWALHVAGWVSAALGLVTVIAALGAWISRAARSRRPKDLIADASRLREPMSGVTVGSWRRPAPNPRFRRSRRRPKRGQREPRALGMPVRACPEPAEAS